MFRLDPFSGDNGEYTSSSAGEFVYSVSCEDSLCWLRKSSFFRIAAGRIEISAECLLSAATMRQSCDFYLILWWEGLSVVLFCLIACSIWASSSFFLSKSNHVFPLLLLLGVSASKYEGLFDCDGIAVLEAATKLVDWTLEGLFTDPEKSSFKLVLLRSIICKIFSLFLIASPILSSSIEPPVFKTLEGEKDDE